MIYIQEAGSAEFRWCNIMYGGHGDRAGIFKTGTGTLSIEDSHVSMVAGDGLLISDSKGMSEIVGSSFRWNMNGASLVKENSSPVFTNCLFIDNVAYGISSDGQTEVFATNCWWGDNTGPYHASRNLRGKGNPVSDNVVFDPWIGKDELEEEEEKHIEEYVVDLSYWTAYSVNGFCFELPAHWYDATEEYMRLASSYDSWKAVGRWYDAEPGFERLFFVIARVDPGSLEGEKADIGEEMKLIEEVESEIAGNSGVWLILTAPEQSVERLIFANQFGTSEDGLALSISFGVRYIDWRDIEENYERIMSTLRYCEF